jgi:hypothetical protein
MKLIDCAIRNGRRRFYLFVRRMPGETLTGQPAAIAAAAPVIFEQATLNVAKKVTIIFFIHLLKSRWN